MRPRWMARGGGGPSGPLIGDSTAQPGDLAASAAAGGEGDHQDRPVSQITEAVAGTGCQQFWQHVASDRLGALAKTLSWRGSDRQPDG